MKISCPSCEAKYSIGDDKVQSRLAKIRCRKCGVDIVIDGRVQPPTVSVGDATATAAPASTSESTAPTPSSSGQSYTVDFGESDQRPMSLDEIVASYNAGYITPETFIWADGMSDWTPLGQVAEIVDALNAAANAPEASEPEPQPVAAPVSRTPAAVASKAARAQGRGGADLFGAIATAGSEEDMARQAAHEPVAQQATTGARNESSVLFSLSALTASAKPSSASATSQLSLSSTSAASASKEDSGLIDLKALTSKAADSASANAVGLAGPSPLGGLAGGLGAPLGGGLGAPLGGLGAPLGGSGMSPGVGASPLGDISYPQKKNRTGLYILGAAGIVALAVVAGLALQPAEVVPPPKAEPAPIVTYKAPEPEPIQAAKPPSTGEAAPSASAAPAKAAPKWKGTAKKAPGSSSSSDKSSSSSSGSDTASTPKKAAPSAGKCGCAAGDLGCAMRCAAKGG